MPIPIQNIYYLLCYAWNKLEEQEMVEVSVSGETNLQELFTKVLITATKWQLKRGLQKSYLPVHEQFNGIKGKLDVQTSVKHQLFPKGLTVCEFDEFSANTLPNQIVKSTLIKLLSLEQFSKNLLQEIRSLLPRFAGIDLIPLKPTIYSRVVLNRDTQFYDFLLKICQLINEQLLIEERDGKFLFKDFLQDERKMAHVFEEFVRNFYRKHLHAKVFREDLKWQIDSQDNAFLPKMQTDISIQFPNKKVIIDTKYYKETFQHYYDKEKIHSANLYQLFAYLKNQSDKNCEGILLYPVVRQEVRLKFQHEEHQIRIETINLNQDWQQIEMDLLAFI